MVAPCLGGYEPVATGWIGRNHPYIDIESAETDRLFQLYAGGRLVGATRLPSDRRVSGLIRPDNGPSPLQILSIDPLDRLVDYSDRLLPLPTNLYRLTWSAASMPADTKRFVITGSTAPGGAVDPANVLGEVRYYGDGDYSFDLPPITACGVWQFAVTPYDDALADGNAGTDDSVSVTVVVPPDDLVQDADGNRFTATTDAGVLAVSLTYPS